MNEKSFIKMKKTKKKKTFAREPLNARPNTTTDVYTCNTKVKYQNRYGWFPLPSIHYKVEKIFCFKIFFLCRLSKKKNKKKFSWNLYSRAPFTYFNQMFLWSIPRGPSVIFFFVFYNISFLFNWSGAKWCSLNDRFYYELMKI